MDSSSFSTSSGQQQSQSNYGQYYTPEALQRLNSIYPTIRQAMPQPFTFGSTLGNVGGATPPSAYPSLPNFGKITVAPVYSDQQINQRVNQMRSQNDASAAGQIRNTAQSLAGRGYGGNSPLYQELSANTLAQNRAGNASAENDLRFQAAAQNAQQILAEQQAQGQLAGSLASAQLNRANAMNTQDLQRRQLAAYQYGLQAQNQNALLNALINASPPLNKGQSSSSGKQSSVSVSRSGGDTGPNNQAGLDNFFSGVGGINQLMSALNASYAPGA
jgi:hypothetical protein